MNNLDWHCKLCGNLTDNRVCWDCYNRLSIPCPECGKPTPTITRMNKTASPLCVACTARANAHTRRIGKTCLVCGNRFQSEKHANIKSVCDECLNKTVDCPNCQQPMPKYKAKGGERVGCSNSCIRKLRPPTPEQLARAHKARRIHYDRVGRRSSLNKIARGSNAYKEWRTAVYKRDDYTCQKCRTRGKELHPHHIKPFATHPELRYEIANGITLCAQCHRKEHKHIFIGKKRRIKPPSRQLKLPTFE